MDERRRRPREAVVRRRRRNRPRISRAPTPAPAAEGNMCRLRQTIAPSRSSRPALPPKRPPPLQHPVRRVWQRSQPLPRRPRTTRRVRTSPDVTRAAVAAVERRREGLRRLPRRGDRRGRRPTASIGAAAAEAEAIPTSPLLEPSRALEQTALADDLRDHRGHHLGHRRAEIGTTIPAWTRPPRRPRVSPTVRWCLRPKRTTRGKLRMIPGRRMAAARVPATAMVISRQVQPLPGRRPPERSARTRTSPALDGVVAGPRTPARVVVDPRAAVERAGTVVVTRVVAAAIAPTDPAETAADRGAGARHPAPGASTTTSVAAVGSGRRPICWA
mmetsp:Transcript_31743/g.93148  ORF Transcript_31743/g.93148 Transcript_31743/m.93148 type:complete len:330 (+) Transcript_31743:252-1241(+)